MQPPALCQLSSLWIHPIPLSPLAIQWDRFNHLMFKDYKLWLKGTNLCSEGQSCQIHTYIQLSLCSITSTGFLSPHSAVITWMTLTVPFTCLVCAHRLQLDQYNHLGIKYCFLNTGDVPSKAKKDLLLNKQQHSSWMPFETEGIGIYRKSSAVDEDWSAHDLLQ